ncbi:MAG: SGNH/GDSL hydrolase family protein [Actinomycetota bacterium]
MERDRSRLQGPFALAVTALVGAGAAIWSRRSGGVTPRPLVYAALGASDTVGVGARDPEREGWPAQIYGRLPAGSTFVRLGVSGSTARQAVAQQLAKAEQAHADLATVWLAVNDFNDHVPLPQYAADLERILRGLRASGARVLVGNMPDLTRLPTWSAIPLLRQEVAAWNRAIARAARRSGAVLVDLLEPSQRLEDASPLLVADDGFHPSTRGHRALAEIFWRAIERDPVIGPAVRGGRLS